MNLKQVLVAIWRGSWGCTYVSPQWLEDHHAHGWKSVPPFQGVTWKPPKEGK